MLKRTFLGILLSVIFQSILVAQTPQTNLPATRVSTDSISPSEKPVINYSATPKKLTIANIRVTGIEDSMYEDYVLITFSGLAVGQQITVPGAEITNAIERFWKQGLFADVKILADKIENDSIWLELRLKSRPRISDIAYSGMKKSEREDIEKQIGMVKGNQITRNQLDRAKVIIKKYFKEKGFGEAEVHITETPDLSHKNQVILGINVDKKEKIKVHSINIEGNEAIDEGKLKWAMKKTNERGNLFNLWRLFRTKKFVESNYKNDKKNIISKYHELGYRDAEIISDTVSKYDNKSVDIKIRVDEGPKYHIRSINWVGNTHFNTELLDKSLNMKAGDVYNQKKLGERLTVDEDAVINIYQNRGYLFSHIDPIEVHIENDSVDLELRVFEGPKATIKRVVIQGNDRLYEDVVRRELRTKPGEVFSKENLIRSLRELAQTGHFDPEKMEPNVVPDQSDGTVDITYPLVTKGNDQIEFSAGWGITGLVGKLSLKLTNFSLKNMLNPKSYRGIIPQGEGQTLILSAQTNGQYYQSYQFSFIDPWFGGKRPNSLSVSAYYSRFTGINSRFQQNMYSNYGGYPYYNPYYGGGYGGYGYGGYGYGGYGGYGGAYQDMYQYAYDPDKYFEMIGTSVGYSKRLKWPDDYFYFQGELAYQRYNLKNWGSYMFPINTGSSNSIALNLTFARNSIDNPMYTRLGSQFSLNVSATPPFSLWDGKDYASMKKDNYGFWPTEKYEWIEYHKWKLKMRTFTPLLPLTIKRTPVIATRAEFGVLGYYNRHKQSPFESFDVGGDGMTGYSGSYATETVALRGYENGSVGRNASAYTRFGLEFRYPFILETSSTIYGVAFVEAGNAWHDLADFNPFDLKRSAGVGARILLPMIGLMGIDWAYGFDPIGNTRGHSGSQFHFIIGQEF